VRRRRLLLAILVYVTLDLSLPTMPGAFVFETGDSVESIGGGRMTARVAVLPTPPGSSMLSASQLRSDLPHRRLASSEVPPLACPRARCLPRACCDPSQPSEDPH